MADTHTHTHEHEPPHPHEHSDAGSSPSGQPEELDTAGRSLSEALRISFTILKVIMIVLVVAFLASGFKAVKPDERALVLRFGKIRGIAEDRVLGPGPHWVFPYPIDEIVRIPVENQVNLAVNSFWYKETREDINPSIKPRNYVPEKLNPVQEGYSLTRSQEQVARSTASRGVGGPESVLEAGLASDIATPRGPSGTGPGMADAVDTEGSDYSIVHTKWQIIYQVDNAERFFTNVYIPDVEPGQVYFQVMTENVTPLLKSVVEDAVVTSLVHYTIDQAIESTDTIRRQVRQMAQQKLDDIESGIRITSVQLVDVAWPKQVNDAFEAFMTTSQDSRTAISEAMTNAENTLNEAAGRVARQLYEALHDDRISDEQLELLWEEAAGEVRNIISQAQTYKAKVVEAAKANADYLTSILPEYNKRPELVAQRIYLDAIEEVLANADEQFILQHSDNAKERETRIHVNRDSSPRPKQPRGAGTTE